MVGTRLSYRAAYTDNVSVYRARTISYIVTSSARSNGPHKNTASSVFVRGQRMRARENERELTSSLIGSKARRGLSPPILRHSLSNAGSVHVLQQRASWLYIHFGSGSDKSPQKSKMSWRTSSMQRAECMVESRSPRREQQPENGET